MAGGDQTVKDGYSRCPNSKGLQVVFCLYSGLGALWSLTTMLLVLLCPLQHVIGEEDELDM